MWLSLICTKLSSAVAIAPRLLASWPNTLEVKGQESPVDRPYDPGAGLGHAFEKSPTVNAVVICILFDEV